MPSFTKIRRAAVAVVASLAVLGGTAAAVAAPEVASASTTSHHKHHATRAEKQAVGMAKDYLPYMPFSKKGLIEQLQYEGFTHSQAVYGVNHAGL